jgi:molybdopterin adenylyltransferase
MEIRTGIVTISDRASAGAYADLSGPALEAAVLREGWIVAAKTVVPDEMAQIQDAIRRQIEAGCNLVLTTGGTGVAPRDVTPEAVLGMARCEVPGFGELMRRESVRVAPMAILSRGLAAVVDRTLVICLPGKPSAAVECLGFVAHAIPHCVELLQPGSCSH